MSEIEQPAPLAPEPPSEKPAAVVPAPEPPKQQRKWWPWAAVGVVVCLGVGAGLAVALHGSDGNTPAETFTLSGTITIDDGAAGTPNDHPSFSAFGDECEGVNGYSDLTPGTAVIVAGADGQTVATGSLSKGTPGPVGPWNEPQECAVPFAVPGVPDDLSSYAVTVSHRGTQVFTLAEAKAGISLSIGQ
ncbi:MAG TPA: hypothetical protein VF444_01420 [Pseudonocardiaceae bacterium]